MAANKLPNIQAWFVNRQVPIGDAPTDIKEQWVDVPLPLRQMSPHEAPTVHIGHGLESMLDVSIVNDGVAVYAVDAVKALALFARPEAAEFWQEMVDPYQVLIFDGSQGQVYPPSAIQRILPGIETFDHVN
jgi:hypothetical protein